MAVVGSTQTLTVTFVDAAGGAVDPIGLALNIIHDGVVILGPLTEPTVIRDAIGLYRYEWAIPLLTVPDTYIAAWSGTVPGAGAPSTGYETIVVTALPTPGDLYAPVAPFGASAHGAAALVPEARLLTGPPVVGTFGVTVAQLDTWVTELTGSVALRLDGWENLTNTPVLAPDNVTVVIPGDRDRLADHARTVIHNGAASYLEAARHPERASGYAVILWDRYTTGLTDLEAWLTKRLADLDAGDTPEADDVLGGLAYSFPDALIGDALRF